MIRRIKIFIAKVKNKLIKINLSVPCFVVVTIYRSCKRLNSSSLEERCFGLARPPF